MLGFESCCDATTYLEGGRLCREQGWAACWNEARPIGAHLLNALAYPHGLTYLSHALLLILAIVVVFIRWDRPGVPAAGPPRRRGLVRVLEAAGAFAVLELLFVGLASVNLTDVPAGVLAILAFIAFHRGRGLAFALAAAGSVLIRAAYLYPMVAVAAYFVAESLYRRRYLRAAAIAVFFAALVPQFWATYAHTGRFTFLDPVMVEFWRNFHMSSSLSGYDTALPFTEVPWPSGAPLGLAAAVEAREWSAVVRLFLGRFDFYFGSLVPLGKAYLDSASERLFSPAVYLLNGVMLLCSIRFLAPRAGAAALRIALPLLLVLAQSLVIIPEQRFVFVIQAFLAIFTYLYLLSIMAPGPHPSS
jgi:hypothetical protein